MRNRKINHNVDTSSKMHCSSLTQTDLVTDLILDFSHDVQIRQTWLHHQHISSFSHVSLLQHRTVRTPTVASTTSVTHVDLPQLEWRVLSLQEAADSNVCPQTQVWTVQHLCVQTQQEASVYSHCSANTSSLSTY